MTTGHDLAAKAPNHHIASQGRHNKSYTASDTNNIFDIILGSTKNVHSEN